MKKYKKILQEISFSFKIFSKENPFLIFSIFFLLGTCIKIFNFYFLFFIPLFFKKRFFFFLIVLSSFFYTSFYYPSFICLKNPEKGSGIFKIHQFYPTRYGYLYTGKFSSLHLSGKDYKNIPCSFCLKKRLLLDFSYKIEGVFSNKTPTHLVGKKCSFQKWKNIYNLMEYRLKIKNIISRKIRAKIKNQKASAFFNAILTGRLEDRFLKFSFQRVGMQHILAISGLHFSLITIFLYWMLKRAVPYTFLPYILLFFVNIYFLYIGNTPSILRAWITIQIALLAWIFNKKNTALNTLGIALFIEVLIDPLYIKNLGFQFSFLSVAAILLSYPIIFSFLEKISIQFFFKKTFFIKFIKKSLGIVLSVNLALLPLLLFYFHKFPLLSLFYNLFIPILLAVSFSLFFLTWIIPIKILCTICAKYTYCVLYLILYPPIKLEFFLRTNKISSLFVAIYLVIYFLFFITIKYRKKMFITSKTFELI